MIERDIKRLNRQFRKLNLEILNAFWESRKIFLTIFIIILIFKILSYVRL